MESRSAQLEREAEQSLWQLSGTLEELRGRITPGHVVDQVIDYSRDSAATDFVRNFGREVRRNPVPLVLIGIGILWLLLASNRTSRAVLISAADRLANKAEDISVATSEAVSRTSEWGHQTAAQLADRASVIASTVGNTAAGLVDRARHVTGQAADQIRPASPVAVTTVERVQHTITGEPADPDVPEDADRPANAVTRQEDAYVDERR
ncbi:MAG TPA: hypothetical protein VGR45_18010 [Stellaceae bacterium]|nr:hypothetical protein [Stellaceae bacterium]